MAKLVILVILGIIFGIVALVAVILGILAFVNNKKSKWAWLTTMIISLIGMSLCIFLFTRKMIKKAKDFSENLEQTLKEHPYEEGTEDRRSFLLDTITHPNAQLALIRSYLPDSVRTQVPDDFYTYFGFAWIETYYREPLRYPYALHSITYRNEADLYNETGITDFARSNDNGRDLELHHIKRLAYDNRFLLIESSDDLDNKHYTLFVFDTESKFSVDSEAELFKLAREKGYKGPDTLMSLTEYDQLFI